MEDDRTADVSDRLYRVGLLVLVFGGFLASNSTGASAGLGVADDLADSDSGLRIRVERRRYGKPMTVVEGFGDSVDLDELASELKQAVGAGGTVADGIIGVQGDHVSRLPAVLEDGGFAVAR